MNKRLLLALLVSMPCAAFPGFFDREPKITVDPRTVYDVRGASMWLQTPKIVFDRACVNATDIVAGVTYLVSSPEVVKEVVETVSTSSEATSNVASFVAAHPYVAIGAVASYCTWKTGREAYIITTEFNKARAEKANFLRLRSYYIYLYDKQQAKAQKWNDRKEVLQKAFEEISWL